MGEFYNGIWRHRPLARGISSVVCLWIGLSVLLTSGCGNSGAADSSATASADQGGLHGKVESYTIYDLYELERFGKYVVFEDLSLPVSSRSLSETGKTIESTYYDSLGRPIMNEKLIEDVDGKETWAKYEYDDNGSGTTEVGGYTSYYFNDKSIDSISGYYLSATNDRVNWVHTYEYLEHGRKTVISSYTGASVTSALQWKHIQKYRDDRLVEAQHRDNKGAVEWTDKFGYDAKGNKTEWSHFLSSGRLDWIERYKYDKAGNEVERARNDSAGHLVSRYIFRYVKLPAVKLQDYLDNGESLFLSVGYDPNQSADAASSFDKEGNWTVKVTLEENNDFGYTYLEVKEIQKRDIQYRE